MSSPYFVTLFLSFSSVLHCLCFSEKGKLFDLKTKEMRKGGRRYDGGKEKRNKDGEDEDDESGDIGYGQKLSAEDEESNILE
ncbi:unnamed protein product [Sphenostylis stenocarpa]|uniref:Uncharacterized protein n=1 Tax=Sphenostylis stenocarpa TaxID=92480 RepID=A0AA86W302_9FABA|nr:unnamed protein product [Sphenostylis stenocarpa]